MLQYILECIAFQLVFLIIYDFFLKRETFFQWNRVYLIGTYILSLILPWIKIEALKTTVPEKYYVYPEFLWNANTVSATVTASETSGFHLSWEEGVLYGGMFMATVYFGYKLYQIYKLRKTGTIRRFPNFTQIIVKNSELAFSFFRSIFLGDKVLQREHQSIIRHELVHIEQRHSWDLLFFELMRIVGWFNPLVYVYQNRISELHEFIADAKVAKTHKKGQYEFLLSEVFQTKNISFINQFFKGSLIKRRILMLKRAKSKRIWQLKYLLLVPLLLGMLLYTSSEAQNSEKDSETVKQVEKEGAESNIIIVNDIENLTFKEQYAIFGKLKVLSDTSSNWELFVRDGNSNMKFIASTDGTYISGPNNERVNAKLAIDSKLKGDTASLFAELFEKMRQTRNDLNHYSDSAKERSLLAEQESMIIKYNQLLAERKRLLKKTDKKNPVIVNLDQQIEALRQSAFGDGEIVPFAIVEQVPVFPGCEDAADKRACFQERMQRHISKNFSYPKEAQQKGIQGRVAVMFTINTKGTIEKIKTRGPDKLLENETKRIIARLPDMKPGKHEGKVVNVPFSIPITFKLQGAGIEKDNSDSGLFEVLPTNIKGVDTDLKKTVDTYNQLVLERKRLLKKSSAENPVIQNLDQQLLGLRQKIKDSGKYDALVLPPNEKRSQSLNQDTDVPFATVDEVPIFPGCEDATDKRACFQESIQRHISKNFRYPREAQKQGVQGRVSVMFTIGKDGNIGNIRLRGPNELLEAEAERIITLLPKMKPGKQQGKVVRVPFSIPITFKLQSEQNEFPLRLDAWQAPQLILIDGEESNKEAMNLINPNDIASINVLKGEYALNRYGEKGKNGVLLVQTKKNSTGIEESDEIYKADTNTIAVSASAKDKNGAKLISGTVTDGSMALPGVTIGIEGTEKGTISDFDGKFELRAKKGDGIILQYIGLPVLRFIVTDETNYQITKKK